MSLAIPESFFLLNSCVKTFTIQSLGDSTVCTQQVDLIQYSIDLVQVSPAFLLYMQVRGRELAKCNKCARLQLNSRSCQRFDCEV